MYRIPQQTYPAVDLSLPPPVGHLGVDLDDVSLLQGELSRVPGAEVVACDRNAHHPGRKHWDKEILFYYPENTFRNSK